MIGRWKRSALLVAAAALCFVVAASLASAAPDARSGPAGGGKELNIMGFGPGDDVANFRTEIAERALPRGTKVDNPRGGFNDQRFLATLASGDVPDLVRMPRGSVGTYAAKGVLQPMNSCVRSERIDMKQYRVAALKEVTYKGTVYGIPEFTQPLTIIVNNDVVRQAGGNPATFSNKNWAQLRALNKKMLKRDGDKVTRIGFDPKIPEFFPMWTKALGHDILSKDGLKARLDHPKAIQALEYTSSLVKDHGGFGPFKAFRDTWDFFGAKNQVAQNQIGAWPMEGWYWNVLAGASPNIDVSAVPFRNVKGGPITMFFGDAWVVPKGAKDPDLACQWAKTITATETWVKTAENRREIRQRRGQLFTGLYTANARADVKIFEDVWQPSGKKGFDDAVRLLVQVQRFGIALPVSPGGAEFRQAYTDAINRVLEGKQTPRQALKQAQKEAQTAIDKNKA